MDKDFRNPAAVAPENDFQGGTASFMPPKFGFGNEAGQAAQLKKPKAAASESFPYEAEVVGATNVALRSKPAKDAAAPYEGILADLPRGTIVTVTGRSGGWLQVEWNGKSGYVSQELLKPKAKAGPQPEGGMTELPVSKPLPADYLGWNPETPERITIMEEGVTYSALLQDLYGDTSHPEALHFIPEIDHTPGDNDPIEVGTVIRIEYRYLKDELKKVYDGTVSVASRESWGADAPDKTKDDYKPYDKPLEEVYHSIAIHMSGNSNKHTMKDVEEEHRDPDGDYKLGDVGYHFGVDLDGKIHQGRPVEVKGSHVEKGNTGVIGIVFLADLESGYPGVWPDTSDDQMNDKMEAGMLRLVHYLLGKYPGISHLGGHNEFNSHRSCPGDMAIEHLESWRAKTGLTKPKAIN